MNQGLLLDPLTNGYNKYGYFLRRWGSSNRQDHQRPRHPMFQNKGRSTKTLIIHFKTLKCDL